MPRFKTPDYGLKMIPVDFDRQVIPGSFEHALCHLVDHEIDLAGLEARYRNDSTGAPAFAPNVLLKIVLLGYSRGLVSSRAIAAACRDNVLFMAVSGDRAPHFTTIAGFVAELGDEAARIFARVLRGSTLNPDFRPFSESDSSSGAGLKATIAKVLWWHVCNSHHQS